MAPPRALSDRRRSVKSGVTVSPPAAWPRAWAWAIVSLAVGLTAHLAAGGGFALDALLISAIVLIVVSRAAATRELRLIPLLALLTAGQIVIHVMFSTTSHGHALASAPISGNMNVAHIGAVIIAAFMLRHREAGEWADARWNSVMSAVTRHLTRATVTLPFAQAAPLRIRYANDRWSITSRCPDALPCRRGPPAFAV